MGTISISKAIRSIVTEKCCKCGGRAKGLIYRNQIISYYCKRCMRKYAKSAA